MKMGKKETRLMQESRGRYEMGRDGIMINVKMSVWRGCELDEKPGNWEPPGQPL